VFHNVYIYYGSEQLLKNQSRFSVLNRPLVGGCRAISQGKAAGVWSGPPAHIQRRW